jgi:two-component system sensor histidine kinase YesM
MREEMVYCMKNTIKVKISNISLKAKISLISVISILIIASAAFVALAINAVLDNKLLYQSIAQNMLYTSSEISNRLSAVQNMSLMIATDSSIQKTLSYVKDTPDSQQLYTASSDMYSFISGYYQRLKQNNIYCITLFNPYFTTYSDKNRSDKIPEKIYTDILNHTQQADGAPYWDTAYTDKYGLFLGRQICRAQNLQLDYLGSMVINVDINSMLAQLSQNSTQYGELSYILVNGNSVISRPPNFTKDMVNATLEIADGEYAVVKTGGHSYFAVRGNIPNFGWQYICLVSYDKITAAMFVSNFACVGIIILAIILGINLSGILTGNIIRHFNILVEKMKSFSKDEIKIPETAYNYEERQDEIGVMHRQFDKMALKIHNLIHVNYVSELLKKDAQLNALQSQINPHFLYNTLNSISWRAKEGGEKEIVAMVEALSTLLRAMLANSDLKFTIGQELELIKCYMYIQKMRYEERLEYEIYAQAEVIQADIPKLTIQPLVENAIKYGLKQVVDVCRIEITINQEQNNIFIRVKNSGSLFEDGLMEKLNSNHACTNGFGIGLLNIDQRLKLMFGDTYGLTLYNTDEIAVAEIKIPYSNLTYKKE